jgi:hypothetical protein
VENIWWGVGIGNGRGSLERANEEIKETKRGFETGERKKWLNNSSESTHNREKYKGRRSEEIISKERRIST